MRIRTLTAPTMADAMAIIRQQLGPEALILGTRKVKNAAGEPTLEITAAVNEPEAPTRAVAAGGGTPLPAAPAAPAAPAGGAATGLAATLARHGVGSALAEKITAALPGLAQAGFGEEEGLEMLLAKLLAFRTPAEALPPATAHAFVGPAGAGKTTLLAKLAVQAHRGGRRVGLLSLDDRKLGGFEPLAITADMLGDAAHLVTTPAAMRAAAAALGPRAQVLIDTPGLNPYRPQGLAALQQQLAGLGIPLTCHLVLPADMNADDMPLLPVACHRFQPAGLVVTRLDCTTRYGALLNTAAGSGLPLGLATHGADVATPPLALTAGWLAGALAAQPRQPWEFTS